MHDGLKIQKSENVHMQYEGFEFYTSGHSNTCALIAIIELLCCRTSNKETTTGNPDLLDSHHDSYKSPGSDILRVLFFILELQLQVEKSVQIEEQIAKELNSLEPHSFDGKQDLPNIFTLVKQSLLNDDIPDPDSINLLYEFFSGDTPKSVLDILLVFKIYGIDLETITMYFEKISKLSESDNIRQCFYLIGTCGMRVVTSAMTTERGTDTKDFHDLRHYSETFCTYIGLLSDISIPDDEQSSCKLITTLMRASYFMGAIDRELEFYSKDSFDSIVSIKSSLQQLEEHKPNKDLLAIAKLEADTRWKAGSPLFHDKMTKALLNEDRFKSLAPTTLRKELVPIAAKYRKVRGLKKSDLGK